MREARSLARLNHSNIVTVYDFGEIDGLFYFSMEYVDGRNLRQLLEACELTPDQSLEIVPQICDALQYAHDEGIVHRDIKPENILIDKRGRVKIADFGLARLVGLTPASLTLTGTHEVMGTLLYMAPEQMKQARSVDHRADIYSLGVVFYEMLTGELPLGRFAPPSHKARIDHRLDAIVLRALAREPGERYQDAGAFKQEVQALKSLAAPPNQQWRQVDDAMTFPTARFHIPHPNDAGGQKVMARGLLRREENALILEFDYARKSLMKKFKAFFKEEGLPQELRIPFRDIASLTYGWGWGKPPRCLELRVTRLAALAGLPGTKQGQVKLIIPREDRDSARRLVESVSVTHPSVVSGQDAVFDPERARLEVAAPAWGIFLAGMITLLSWMIAVPVVAIATQEGSEPPFKQTLSFDMRLKEADKLRENLRERAAKTTNDQAEIAIEQALRTQIQSLLRDPHFVPGPEPILSTEAWVIVLAGALLVPVSIILIVGSRRMARLQSYPLAATSSILAMIPFSPGWLIGLPFGIWACVALGRPYVVQAFVGDPPQTPKQPLPPPKPPGLVAGRFLSLLRSIGGYMIPTFHGRNSNPAPTANYEGRNQQANEEMA
jgi:hypothetical protein